MQDFSDRVMLVTGATSGISRAAARSRVCRRCGASPPAAAMRVFCRWISATAAASMRCLRRSRRITAVSMAHSTMLCLRPGLGLMHAQGSGSIVNTASIVGMTKSAALDFPDKGIRVNCRCPGGTRTPMAERWVDKMPGGCSLS